MLINQNTNVVAAFKQGIKYPVLLYGKGGIGKLSHILTGIQYLECKKVNSFEILCTCPICTKIRTNRSLDLILINSNNIGIDEFKEKINAIIKHKPSELSNLYLIIEDIHLLSKDVLDTFLKILEENSAKILIFATTQTLDIVDAIQSRFHTFKLKSLTRENIIEIVNTNENLKPYKSITENFMLSFDSIDYLTQYRRFQFEDYSKRIWNQVSVAFEMTQLLQEFFKLCKSDKNSRFEEVVFNFLDFYRKYVLTHIENSDGFDIKRVDMFLMHYQSLFQLYQNSLFQYLLLSNHHYYINIENQIFSYLMSLNILMRLLKK